MMAQAVGKIQLVFFDHYIYQASVKMDPITFKPFIGTMNYHITKPRVWNFAATMELTFGKLETTIYQLNRKYKGSLLEPLFDDTAKYEDHTDDFDGENNYYITDILGDAPETAGLWSWSPAITTTPITGTYFTWDLLAFE